MGVPRMHAPSPGGPKLFHFHAVFSKKNCKIICFWKLAAPPQETPGSATCRGLPYAPITIKAEAIPQGRQPSH